MANQSLRYLMSGVHNLYSQCLCSNKYGRNVASNKCKKKLNSVALQDLGHKFSTMFLAVFIYLQSRHIKKQ